MSWFVVGGVAIGATAGAAIGSEKGGDDVWKGALIGGALGAAGGAGAGLGSGAGVLGGIGAETAAVAAPATTAVVPAAAGAAPTVAAPTVAAPTATGIFGGVAPTVTGEVGAYGAGISGAGSIPGGAGITSVAPSTAVAPTTASGSLSAGQGLFAVPEVTSPTTASVAPQITGNATWNLGTVGGAEAQPGAYMASKEAAMSPLQSAFNSTLGFMKDNPFLVAGAGYFGLNALGAFDNQNEGQPFGTNKDMTAGYPMSPSFRPSREDPEKYRYTARYAAEGGIMSYAPGGMVQQDPMNPIQNPIYPQSQQQQTNFATSTQYPNSIKSAMASDYDARTNPMTGQEMPMGMAAGGQIDLHGSIDFGGSANQVQGANGYAPASVPAWGGAQYQPQPYRPQQYQQSVPASGDFINAMVSPAYTQRPIDMVQGTPQTRAMGMAAGGIAHYKTGREVYAGAAQEFAKMADRKLGASAPDTPDWVRSKGIYSDTDPSTRYKNAVDAAITRNAATAKKFDLGGAQLKVPTGGLGSINMGPITKDKKGTDADSDEAFAAGGISTLGGYAHGGNPRLLRGPGDGMSDDIPATIAGRQPARLADGEFVVPADVVSALGNGSTEAGAKHLHAMMDRARQKAHGKKTQMKKVNAKKVLPV